MTKISIRFFNDREVRAIWDEENSKWWYSVPDIIGVLNEQDDYTRNRNYWKYLKAKLKKEGNEVVSATNQLKLMAPDGKRRLTDTLDSKGVIALAKSFPTPQTIHEHCGRQLRGSCRGNRRAAATHLTPTVSGPTARPR